MVCNGINKILFSATSIFMSINWTEIDSRVIFIGIMGKYTLFALISQLSDFVV